MDEQEYEDDYLLTNDYCKRSSKHYIELLEKHGTEEEKERIPKIKESIFKREQVDEAAKEMIREHGLAVCSSMAVVKAEDNPRLVFVFQVGWEVDGFRGVAHFCNSLSGKACDRGDYEQAVMLRMFALCAIQAGIGHITTEVVEDILIELYALEVSTPTQEEWDKATATSELAEAEVEFDWQQSQENNDDELD